jgi:hypothetical protein
VGFGADGVLIRWSSDTVVIRRCGGGVCGCLVGYDVVVVIGGDEVVVLFCSGDGFNGTGAPAMFR